MKQQIPSMVVLLLLTSCVMAAEADEHSWASLQQLKEGQHVVLNQKDMKSHQGTFLRYSDEAVSMLEKGSEVTVQRSDVLLISMRGKPKRFRNALIGGLVGGVIAGAAYQSGEAVFLGLWPGVAVGALLPLHSNRTIYRAGP